MGKMDGQTVVVIGGSSDIGLETARQARGEGAEVIITGRDQQKLAAAATQIRALDAVAFDVDDTVELERFLAALPEYVDHILLAAGGPSTPRWRRRTSSGPA